MLLLRVLRRQCGSCGRRPRVSAGSSPVGPLRALLRCRYGLQRLQHWALLPLRGRGLLWLQTASSAAVGWRAPLPDSASRSAAAKPGRRCPAAVTVSRAGGRGGPEGRSHYRLRNRGEAALGGHRQAPSGSRRRERPAPRARFRRLSGRTLGLRGPRIRRDENELERERERVAVGIQLEGVRSDSDPMAIRLGSSDSDPTAIRLGSDGDPTRTRRQSDSDPTAILPRFGAQPGARLPLRVKVRGSIPSVQVRVLAVKTRNRSLHWPRPSQYP